MAVPPARSVTERLARAAAATEPHGTQERAPILAEKRKIGAGEGIRTLDPDLGKVVLYP